MAVIHLAHTAPANPPGAAPPLTQAQVWAGLQRKARRPQDFVPVVESCEVLAEERAPGGDTTVSAVVHFKFGIVAHALHIRETCTLRPPCRLDYAMEDGSSAVNVVSEGPGGELYLTFVFAWLHEDLVPGSEEAREAEEHHKRTAATAVGNTLGMIRKFVEQGEL